MAIVAEGLCTGDRDWTCRKRLLRGEVLAPCRYCASRLDVETILMNIEREKRMGFQECSKHPDTDATNGCWMCAELQPLQEALEPFAAVADEYETNGLDECRPEWVMNGCETFDLDHVLFRGRGGRKLISLRDVGEARRALNGKPLPVDAGEFVKRARCLFEALYLGGPTWEQLSDDDRMRFIEKARKVLK